LKKWRIRENIYKKKDAPQLNKLDLHLVAKLPLELAALRLLSPVGSFIHEGDLLLVERGEEADFLEHTC
jgi:hypothetical protein